MADREIEIKLALCKETYEAMLHRLQRGLRPGESFISNVQENVFFDTEDRVLKDRRWALRIRCEADAYTMTLKGPARTDDDGFYDRPEFEASVEGEKALQLLKGFRIGEVDNRPCRKLLSLYGDLSVRARLSFVNRRTYIPRGPHLLELDKTEIGRHVFYELEVETTHAMRGDLLADIRTWFQRERWPYRLSEESKLSRAERIMVDPRA